jgi:hypothetical protein
MVFPGENWFFYWKTSASLWRNKIDQLHGVGQVFIPINWSIHSDTGERFDFAFNRPETNLKLLVDTVREAGKVPVLFLPLTPCPFLTNGGVPHLLAREMSLNNQGIATCTIDNTGHLNKMYSFYDTRVFKFFSKFIIVMRQYLEQNDVEVDIWGLDSGIIENEKYISFFHDQSKLYKHGLSQFLRAKREEEYTDGQSQEFRNVPLVSSIEDELKFRDEYETTISDLYKDFAKKELGNYWEGVIKMSFLGGGLGDFFTRNNHGLGTEQLCKNLYQSIALDVVPSSILLAKQEKKEIVSKQLHDIVTSSILPHKLASTLHTEEKIYNFAPLMFFSLYQKNQEEECWEDIGLSQYLDNQYQHTYQYFPLKNFEYDENELSANNVKVFNAKDLDVQSFNNIIREFMKGSKIILNTAHIDHSLTQKLELFLLENEFQIEKVNFQTLITHITLGEGQLLFFNAEEITETKEDKKKSFWKKIISIFNLAHLDFGKNDNSLEGVKYFWLTRQANTSELKFEEIRRLLVYNTSSYKRRLKLPLEQDFSLLKIIDEMNTTITPHGKNIDLFFYPKGSVLLDFGVLTHER